MRKRAGSIAGADKLAERPHRREIDDRHISAPPIGEAKRAMRIQHVEALDAEPLCDFLEPPRIELLVAVFVFHENRNLRNHQRGIHADKEGAFRCPFIGPARDFLERIPPIAEHPNGRIDVQLALRSAGSALRGIVIDTYDATFAHGAVPFAGAKFLTAD
jgi:hypothetical protein